MPKRARKEGFMKHTKRIFAILLSLAMVMTMMITMTATVFADAQVVHGTNVETNKGSITITNATVGKKYGIYKLFDATVALNADGTAKLDSQGKPIINYTVPTGKTLAEDNAWFKVDANGNVSVKENADITTAAFKTWAKGFASEVKKDVVATDSSLTFDQLEFGYYYIQSEVGAVLTIDSTTPSATVIDKNQTSSFEKNIIEQDEDGNDIKVKANEAGLKEDVDFNIEVSATNYSKTDKVFKYVITDTLEAGMTYKAAPTVKVNGNTVTPASIVYYKADGTTTTTTLSEAQKAVITINWTADGTKAGAHLYPASSTIDVDYTAFLDPAKKDQLVVGGTTDGNTNEAEVKFFKGPDETTPSGDLGKDHTDTFTTELAILKQDQDGNALQGAEFTLTGPTGAVVITTKDVFTEDASGQYWKLKDGTYTTDDPTAEGMDQTQYESTEVKYKKETTTTVTGNGQTQTAIKVEVGSDGKATFTGLGAGDYTLSETKVPDGYNKIADITFTIGFTTEQTATGYSVKFTSSNRDVKVGADNKLSLTVENQKGVELPATGGIGTVIFYVLGAALLIGCGVVLVSKRRMTKEK
jgi:fimbrial isopeptide formation D2 family protein/LPXTG-motif cell wall-anchored protein